MLKMKSRHRLDCIWTSYTQSKSSTNSDPYICHNSQADKSLNAKLMTFNIFKADLHLPEVVPNLNMSLSP